MAEAERLRPGRSVRFRITLAVAVLSAAALAVSGAVVYLVGVQQIRSQTVPAAAQQKITGLSVLQARGTDPSTGQPFTAIGPLVRDYLEHQVPSSSQLLVGWWDDEVQVSSASARVELRDDPAFVGAVRPRVARGGSTEIATDYGPVRIDVQPIRAASGDPGAFVVASFLDDELEPLRQTMATYTLAALLALALLTVVAALVAGRLLRPVRVLRSSAEEITATDLSRRIPVSGNDDITDLTRTINAMLDRLEGAFSGQRRFLDDAGHELRTPLTVLGGHLELLDADDAEEVQRTRTLLLDEVDRMSGLVDDLILLTKSGRPGFLQLQRTDAGELAMDVLDKARGLVPVGVGAPGHHAWSLDVRATAAVDVDRHRLTQALLQLVENAVAHSPDHDTVSVGCDLAESGEVLLWVEDGGPGVPIEERSRIFERFARLGTGVRPDGQRREGSGLGLSIVRAIVEAHDGRVHVEDADRPTGARFVITLPRAEEVSA